MHKKYLKVPALGVCLGGALISGSPWARAQDATESDASRLEKLEKENEVLKSRLESLETMFKDSKTQMETGSKTPNKTLEFLADSTLSGFVTASYFYDTSKPSDGVSNGYLWSHDHNSFTINKFKIALDKPAERSGDKWSAGYHASAIFGQDAPLTNTGGENQGLEELRQAYVEVNAPIGNGLNLRAGQLISLLNFESGDGGAVNPNFSQGNQWFFTGNGPSAGVQASYAFNDTIDATFRVQNGLYAGVKDNNNDKTVMGSIGVKPTDSTWVKFLGFAGNEGIAGGAGGNNDMLAGAQILAGATLNAEKNINIATELTYMHWDDASFDVAGDAAEAYSAGIWVWGDLNEKLGWAVRGDYVNDRDGGFTSGLLGFPINSGQEIASATFTLNYFPTPQIKIQPELRFERTSLDNGFDGTDGRVIAGMGASYLF